MGHAFRPEENVIAAATHDTGAGDDAADGLAGPGEVPAEVLRAATAAFRTASGGEAVADCVRDSLLAGGGVSPGPRRLEFRAPEGEVALTVSPSDELLELAVQVTPPTRCALEVRQLSHDGDLQRALAAETDDEGRAVVQGVPTGIASVAVRPLDGAAFPPLRTAWLRL